MEEKETSGVTVSDEVGRFAESYASFNNVISRLQRQYLSLKDTHTRQSEELQSVNRTLQSMVVENRAVTEFLNSILNSLSSGVIAVNKSGLVTHINPSARRILNISEDIQPRQGLTYDDIIEAVDNQEYSATGTIKTGRNFERMEKRIRLADGRTIVLSVATSQLRTEDGRLVGAVELFQDISRIKRMEEQLSRMKILASLGEMAASIAHEVRNPLVAVSGFATFLARDCVDDPSKADMAKKIVDGVNSINRTIQTLLDFARHETLHKSIIPLDSYLDLICGSFCTEHDIDDPESLIRMEIDEDAIIEVDLDRQLFRQAIFNILANARDAGGPEVTITIRAILIPPNEANQRYGDRIELAGDDPVAVIEIEDDGPGIPEESLENIFSPFYSTKKNGNGLGLAIAWKIIKAHCGDIKVTSEMDRGTKFNIVLPARPAANRGDQA